MVNWKKLKPKNPILFTLLAVFLILNVVDSITAFFILPGESNPIFLMVGNIWPIVMLKVVIIGALIFYHLRNKYPSEFMYYLIVLILMLGISIVGLASYGNIQGIMEPELVEKAAAIPNNIKAKAYWGFVTWLYYIPLAFCIFTFILYDKSKKHIDVDPQFFKRSKWWKR